MVTNSATQNLPSFNFPSPLFSLLISSSESHRETGTSATPRSPLSKLSASLAAVIKTLQVNGLFCLCADLFDVVEALKQYFRSRHGKTLYTEEEPSTLFFLRIRHYKVLPLTIYLFILLYCTVCTGALHYISGGRTDKPWPMQPPSPLR